MRLMRNPWRAGLSAVRRGLGWVALSLAAGVCAGEDAADLVPLTTAAAVRSLSAAEAAKHLPVRLEGVIISRTATEHGSVLVDETEGIYVFNAGRLPFDVRRGEQVEIIGVTDPGDYAPIVELKEIRRLGVGHLPEPRVVSFAEVIKDGLDAQWVEFEGLVLRCEPSNEPTPASPRRSGANIGGGMEDDETGSTRLVLGFGDLRVAVRVARHLRPEDIEDAWVRVRGVCFNVHNTKRQFLSSMVQVPYDERITIVVPPPAAPFATEPVPISSLFQFSRDGSSGHRVHLRGQVTHQDLGRFVWLRDDARGVLLHSDENVPLEIGEIIDVIGFPRNGPYSPIVEHARVRRAGRSEPLAAFAPHLLEEVLKHDADLIQIEAELRAVRAKSDTVELLLSWQGHEIIAQLSTSWVEQLPSGLEPGSVVQVVGICTIVPPTNVRLSGLLEPRVFRMLVRGPADLSVVQPAPWWTAENTLRVVTAVTVLAGLIALILWGLGRRQLRVQTESRRSAEREFSAVLRERNRLAREIHDTLAQGLNAVSMQLELVGIAERRAKIGEPLAGHLATAHRIVRETLLESRRSIWNMRSQALETQELTGALRGVLHRLVGQSGLQVEFKQTGEVRPLSPQVETHLLRIGQEAVHNVIKHARARTLSMALHFGTRLVELVVVDDGVGFDPEAVSSHRGCFGLVGMKERIAEINGELAVQSSPAGTRVVVKIPTPAE